MKKRLTETDNWKLLASHLAEIKSTSIKELFATNINRVNDFRIEAEGIYFDYSKHRINDTTMSLLIGLARERGLEERIRAMFSGEKINKTEQRAVLHTALRAPADADIRIDGENVVPEVHRVLDKMKLFADQIRDKTWLGYTGKPVSNIVNIGIGGSDLGPLMAYEALKFYSDRSLSFSFVSNVDGNDFAEAVRGFEPDETLFIVSSKTFTTLETMTNARTARKWIVDSLGDEKAIERHFVAVSTNKKAVEEFGINTDNMFVFWDWVGGRYSMDASIGLSTMIAIGPDNFHGMLKGFHRIDDHFRNTPLGENIPVIMALLTVWYTNFFGAQTQAVFPYENNLKRFPAYLQQLTMESNGKSVTLDGEKISYQSGPIFWGEPGTNGQHSFYQLLHQGTHLVPADFIGFKEALHTLSHHQDYLIANIIAQGEALAFGKTADEVRSEGVPETLIQHKVFEGNRPSSTFFLDKLTPEALGKMIALYEHSVFVQGAVWGINSFDQMGVELGKQLAQKIIRELEDEKAELSHDSSTNALINYYRKK
ncbi:MAG: glucose-6-phosphate isomerase [Bacteroidales bacterium]|nr:glucose-6-phosphate isomerase [Bacteroidales bacterium]